MLPSSGKLILLQIADHALARNPFFVFIPQNLCAAIGFGFGGLGSPQTIGHHLSDSQ